MAVFLLAQTKLCLYMNEVVNVLEDLKNIIIRATSVQDYRKTCMKAWFCEFTKGEFDDGI